jgi:predicted lipid-binding transport protein (Tim44 family)
VSPSADSGSSTIQVPAWFDVQGFVAGAKSHFLRLQSSWDKAEFNDIREYTTPELFNELQRERMNLGSKPQFTEVVTLNVALAAVRREGSQVVVSLEFSGLIREEANDTAQPFREIWHINHEWENAAGDWFVAGIQQVES